MKKLLSDLWDNIVKLGRSITQCLGCLTPPRAAVAPQVVRPAHRPVPQRNNYTPQKPKASSKEKPKSLFFSAAGSFVSNACAAVKDIGEDFEEFGKDVLREVEDAEPKVQKIIKDIPNKIEKMGNKISNITIDDVSDIVKKKFFGP